FVLPPPPLPLFPYTTLFRFRARRSPHACPKVSTLPVTSTPTSISISMASASRLLIPLILALLCADSVHAQRPTPIRLSFAGAVRSEEHTSELQSPCNLVCRL